jgi:demethylmenaquinone methyltransferase/2-methoxy-6-polyprenyl-1,4-benzoquinol methylase
MTMTPPKALWMPDNARRKTPDSAAPASDKAFFGFERIAADEKEGRVRRHFDSIAEQYDFMNTLLSFGIHYAWKRAAVRRLKLMPGQRVLDVCGGTGDLAIMAARRVGASGRVFVYDINRAMMLAGRPKLEAGRLADRIAFIQGNAEIIAAPDESFDAAMVGFGIRNVTHMNRAFAEMCRVLKPGGRMMCLEFSKPTFPVFRWLYDRYSFHVMPFLGELIAGSRKAYTHLPESIRTFPQPGELADLLRGAGFVRVNFRRLTNGIAVIHLAVK